jgi:hypothetical protein
MPEGGLALSTAGLAGVGARGPVGVRALAAAAAAVGEALTAEAAFAMAPARRPTVICMKEENGAAAQMQSEVLRS